MKIFILAVLLAMTSFVSHAEVQSSKGMASIIYKGKATTEIKQQAVVDAQFNALERYIAESNPAKARSFDAKKQEVLTRITDFVLSSTILSEDDSKDRKTYSVVLRADINEARLQNLLNDSNVQAKQSSNSISKTITFVFVSRMQSSVQQFDERVYKRSDSNTKSVGSSKSNTTASESENISSSSASINEVVNKGSNSNSKSSVTNESGGSSTQKADKIEWSVTSSNEVNTSMTGVFSDAGLDVVEAEYVEGESRGLLNLASIRKDYSTGSDIAPQNLRNMVTGVKSAGIYFIATGTLDVGMKDRDPVSGNTRVFVTVNGKVMDISGKFPKTISSVGPMQYAGLGPSENAARTNALKLAAEQTAKQMIDELNTKGF